MFENIYQQLIYSTFISCIGKCGYLHSQNENTYTTSSVPIFLSFYQSSEMLVLVSVFNLTLYNTIFFLTYLFYLFLAALGLHCCARAFSSCSERGLLFIVARGLLIAVASCFAEHTRSVLGVWASVVTARGLSSCGLRALECSLSSCGARAQLLCGMWDLPGPGLEPVSPALAGGFLTSAPPGKPLQYYF